ncbi:MAG: AraC family transcriptional regulator [Lachnospiraceae bacterium]|nr:AraC family transcriptional regulator [Lachnospiraceae bacterium]
MKKELISIYDDKQYMLDTDFELYYYSDFSPQSRTLMHSHGYYEFYFFLEGHAEAIVGKNHYILSYGDVLIVPPGTSHGIAVKDYSVPYRRFDFWISRDFYESLCEQSPDFNFMVNKAVELERFRINLDRITFNSIQAKLFTLIEEKKSKRFGKNLRLILNVSDLLLSLNRIVYEMGEEHQITGDALYQNICTYIEHHIDEDLSLDNIASHFYLSKFYISHVFKDNIGISIHKYIARKRLELCRDALRGDVSITDVYQNYGFDDYSSFYRSFKKEYGLSPKEFKKRSKTEVLR